MTPDYAIALIETRPIDSQALRRLFDDAGWWPEREIRDIRSVLDSGPAVGAWLEDELVGFARAVSDGIFRAYVEDVVVATAHRGRGIGARMMDALLEDLEGIHTISLFCEDSLVPLYSRSGFRPTKQRVLHRQQIP